MNDQDREAFEKWWMEGFKGMSDMEVIKYVNVGKQTSLHGWQAACEYKQKELNEVELREISVNRSFVDLARKFVELQKAFDDRVRVIEMQLEDKKKLKREIEVLRLYGNKDCTAMADEVLEND